MHSQMTDPANAHLPLDRHATIAMIEELWNSSTMQQQTGQLVKEEDDASILASSSEDELDNMPLSELQNLTGMDDEENSAEQAGAVSEFHTVQRRVRTKSKQAEVKGHTVQKTSAQKTGSLV